MLALHFAMADYRAAQLKLDAEIMLEEIDVECNGQINQDSYMDFFSLISGRFHPYEALVLTDGGQVIWTWRPLTRCVRT